MSKLPPGHGGYRAVPADKAKPDTRKTPPLPPRPSKGAATQAAGSCCCCCRHARH